MILMWGKSRGLTNYNQKNNATSVLKKHFFHEQLDQYKKVGVFFYFIEGVKNWKWQTSCKIMNIAPTFSYHRLLL